MNDNDDFYEDEIDRMRKRREARSNAYRRSDSAKRAKKSPTTSSAYEGKPEAGRRTSPASRRAETTSGRTGRPPIRHRKKRKRFFPVPILAAFAMLIGGFFLFRHLISKQETYWTVAVFGLDSRDGRLGKGALSDVEMLCTVNRKTGELRLASVFRDTYLKIDPDGTYDKVNEAYFLGGPEQAIHTLQDNLDLSVDNYATFNWKAVVDTINILGGVDIEITESEFAYINSFITETVESTGVGSVHLTSAGANHLDGVQAVAYARLRLMDTDFTRTERQRKVLGLALEKARKADLATLTTLISTVYPQISTSIGLSDILQLAKNAKKYYIGQTSGFPFSHQERKIDGKSCVIATTLESNVIQLHAFLYDETEYTPSDTVIDVSSHIIEVTGLGDVGKDTESGKNVGAEGYTEVTNPSGALQTAAETTADAETLSEETTAEATETDESVEESETSEADDAPEETVEAFNMEPIPEDIPEERKAEPSGVEEQETPDDKHAITQGQAGNPSSSSGPAADVSQKEPGNAPGTSEAGRSGGPGIMQ